MSQSIRYDIQNLKNKLSMVKIESIGKFANGVQIQLDGGYLSIRETHNNYSFDVDCSRIPLDDENQYGELCLFLVCESYAEARDNLEIIVNILYDVAYDAFSYEVFLKALQKAIPKLSNCIINEE